MVSSLAAKKHDLCQKKKQSLKDVNSILRNSYVQITILNYFKALL